MNRTKMLALLAGAAMSAGVTHAQTANNSALERELLADAGARASFQAGGTAGHDGSFFLSDAAGNNRLEIGGYTQFRYTFNNRDTVDPDEDFTNGFDMTRAALEFGGNVGNANLGYYIRGYFDTADSGTFEVWDAFGTYTFDNGVTMVFGQFLAPVLRERNVDDRNQLAVDRSVAGNTFDPGYTQGIAFAYTSDNFKVIGSVNDGAGTSNTPYYSARENDWALTGRVEFKWSGDWAQFDDFTSWRGTEGYAGMIGGGFHWETSGNTDADTGGVTGGAIGGAGGELMLYSIDVSAEGNGWNAFGAFIGRSIDPDGGSSVDDFAAVAQAGVFMTDEFEIFGRWDSIFADTGVAGSGDFHTITFGGNYYFFPGSHVAKFTADVQWNLENQGDANTVVGFGAPNQSTGVLTTADDSQWMLRLQMQLVF
ncbi:hypothetical protein MNBD_PLANCTO03-147 [hydrothermal vent metagenome]|uniref:Porin n=1 Tax=hydrothermal vent metagenome TaxID=652676 RepID=A0A3B1DCY2_9ZZZZ